MKSLPDIIRLSARACGLTPARLVGKQRNSRVAAVRHNAMQWAYEEGHTQSEIARAFNRDRSTVGYAVRKDIP